MRLLQALPFVALIACVAALASTAVWHERYLAKVPESPCVVSWDENVDAGSGPTTFCILTREAATREHTLYARK